MIRGRQELSECARAYGENEQLASAGQLGLPARDRARQGDQTALDRLFALAANMSTCSASWSIPARSSPRGSTGGHIAPGRPDSHYLWVGRMSGVAVTMLGALYAMYLIGSVLYSFLLTETMATFIGISVLGGIVCPRDAGRAATSGVPTAKTWGSSSGG